MFKIKSNKNPSVESQNISIGNWHYYSFNVGHPKENFLISHQDFKTN